MPSNTSKPTNPADKPDRPGAIPAKTQPSSSARRRLAFVAAALVLALAAGAGAWQAERRAFHKPGEFAGGIVAVAPGSPLAVIGADLHRGGVIADARLFRLSVTLRGLGNRLQAGEFRIPAQASMAQVAEILASGRAVEHPFTAAEGASSHEIAALLRQNPLLSGEIAAVPAEGSLLPETYHFRRGGAREALLARMALAQQEALARLWRERASGLPLQTPQEAVILASIVEKETALPSERPLIAAVFLNRLRRGMRLQADPTVIYGLTLGKAPLGRPLTRGDLQADTPYNTYRRGGLPPTPICNPGLASLEAVLNPMESDLLYFVADGEGGHRFAATLAQHRRNVALWRER